MIDYAFVIEDIARGINLARRHGYYVERIIVTTEVCLAILARVSRSTAIDPYITTSPQTLHGYPFDVRPATEETPGVETPAVVLVCRWIFGGDPTTMPVDVRHVNKMP